MEVTNGSYIKFDYINWRGVQGHRQVKVKRIFFGLNEYHPGEQWLMEAFDEDKQDVRTFAMKDITNVIHW